MESDLAPDRRALDRCTSDRDAPGHEAQRRSPMWMSHHWPDDYDRCAQIGGRHFCRRCLWFYPVCFATTVLSLAGLHWPAVADPWILWLASVPVVVEWWAEHRGWIGYSARRQIVTSVIVAPAVGRGLARYLSHPGDHLFWAVVLTYAVICLIPVLVPRRRRRL